MQENFNSVVIRPLQEILAARDARSLLRKEFSVRHLPTLSLNLNVPGYPKSNEIVRRFFLHCLDDLKVYMAARLIRLDEKQAILTKDEAGDFYIVPFSTNHHSLFEIKQFSEDFEETHAWGRFTDVDITDHAGMPVSSGKSKSCFYCYEYPADECRRDKRHETGEVREFMFSKMSAYCMQQREITISKNLSSLALQSILAEISLTPKPGLVDKFSNGVHSDMNYNTFIHSTAAISGYFNELAQAGFAFAENDMTRALPVIRNIGLRMEKSMFESTNHVNTQKGIIFLMGLSLFSSGYLFAHEDVFQVERFRTIIKDICRDLTKRELEIPQRPPETHGEHIYRKLKMAGARGEAENGFPTVFDFGLPELLKFNELDEQVLLRAFLAIAANNIDTNILYRSNADVLNQFRELSKTSLKTNNVDLLADFCLQHGISPGGSADLLAVSIYLYLMIKHSRNNELLNFPTLIS
jgi:holo-ACP synthase / triphosphoribosyl-dephospho-CoA synthase